MKIKLLAVFRKSKKVSKIRFGIQIQSKYTVGQLKILSNFLEEFRNTIGTNNKTLNQDIIDILRELDIYISKKNSDCELIEDAQLNKNITSAIQILLGMKKMIGQNKTPFDKFEENFVITKTSCVNLYN
jgi:hypothetical protein